MANSLNPSTPDSGATPFVRATSQGFESSMTPFAELFKNVGQLGTTAVNVADEANVGNIKSNVRSGISNILGGEGYNDKADPNADMPQGLTDYGAMLAKTKQAYESGSIKQSNFDIRVDALSKKVRAQFPGYDDQVDKIIGQQLNLSTANDLRRSLQSEWDKQISQNQSQENKDQTELKDLNDNGKLLNALPDYYQKQAAGTPYSMTAVRYAVGQDAAKTLQLSNLQAQNALLAENGKLTKEHTLDTANKEASMYADNMIKQGTSTFNYQDALAKMGPDASKWKPDDITSLLSSLNSTMAGSTVDLQKITNKYPTMTAAEKQSVVENGLAPLKAIKDALVNKDIGVLSFAQTANDFGTQQKVYKFQHDVGDDGKQNPVAAYADKVKMARNLLGEDAYKQYLTSPEGVTDSATAVSSFMKAKLMADGAPMVGLIKAGQGADSTMTNAQKKDVFTTAIKASIDPNVPDAAKSNTMKSLFDPANASFLDALSGDKKPNAVMSEREDAFQKMTSPAMTDSVMKLGKSDPNVINNYKNYMGRAFTSLFNTDINNVKGANASSDSMNITYDPQTMKFTPKFSGNSTSIFAAASVSPNPFQNLVAGGTVAAQWYQNSSAQDSISKLNTYMSNLAPAMKATGNDPNQAITELIKDSGALDTPNSKGSLLTKAYTAVTGALANASKKDNVIVDDNVDQQGMPHIQEHVFQPPDTNFRLRNFIGQAEGADYNTMQGGMKMPLEHMTLDQVKAIMDYNKSKGNTTASGKYQILKDTLDAQAGKLGLKGTDIFDGPTQDRMANSLIDEAKTKGKIDPAKLANTWASLPKANGQSAYEGVGGNHATVSYEDMLNSFQ